MSSWLKELFIDEAKPALDRHSNHKTSVESDSNTLAWFEDWSFFFYRNARFELLDKIDTSNGVMFDAMFYQSTNAISISGLDTSKGTSFRNMFYACTNLTSVSGLNLDKATSVTAMFDRCSNLTDLYLYNIRAALTIGSGTSWGHLLTVDSLVHTVKELCKVSSATTLTMGTANLEKIANLYCRVLDDTTEKIEMELCESTDEGAMTLADYALLKNWTFA